MIEKLLSDVFTELGRFPVLKAGAAVLAVTIVVILPFWPAFQRLVLDQKRIDRVKILLDIRKQLLDSMAVMKEKQVCLPPAEEHAILAQWWKLAEELEHDRTSTRLERSLLATGCLVFGFFGAFVVQLFAISIHARLRLSGWLGLTTGVATLLGSAYAAFRLLLVFARSLKSPRCEAATRLGVYLLVVLEAVAMLFPYL